MVVVDSETEVNNLSNRQFKRSCTEVKVEHVPLVNVAREIKTTLFIILNLIVVR